MSLRQDIDLNDWYLFEKSSMHPYIPSLRNDIDPTRHPDHAPESIVRPEQFTPPSFDQVPGTDRTNTSSALGTYPHEQRTPDDHENTTWPWEFNLPWPMNSPPGHPAARILPKHGSTQGAKTNTRRRQKKQVKKVLPTSLICKWAECDQQSPFACEATLMRHVKTQHVAPRSIPCRDESCDQVFSRKDNMVMHFRAVHADVH